MNVEQRVKGHVLKKTWRLIRRRENMVGVNMVLAEFVKFKHGLYKSCGIEWLEGIMLEPCLLQPCFHVAGRCREQPRLILIILYYNVLSL